MESNERAGNIDSLWLGLDGMKISTFVPGLSGVFGMIGSSKNGIILRRLRPQHLVYRKKSQWLVSRGHRHWRPRVVSLKAVFNISIMYLIIE